MRAGAEQVLPEKRIENCTPARDVEVVRPYVGAPPIQSPALSIRRRVPRDFPGATQAHPNLIVSPWVSMKTPRFWSYMPDTMRYRTEKMSNRVGLTIIACSLGVVFFVACRSALNSLENDEPNVLAGFEYDPNDNRYLEATIGSTCKEVAVNWQNVHLSGPMKNKTRKPSEKLLPDFSLYGRVAVYPDNKMETLRTDRLFWDDIDARIGLSRREALAKNDHGGFGEAAFEAFDQYRHYINGKRGGVINAPTSWVEAAAFQHGAASMMSIGYRQVEIQSANNLTFMHPLDICKQQRDTVNSLDFAAAFTTIERSGLGRFNEALDPWGDLRMMAMVRCLLKFDGIFVLGVPLGEDALFWNSHRTYGSLRLSWLVRGYKLLGSVWVEDGERKSSRGIPQKFLTRAEGDKIMPAIILQKVL